MTGISSPFADRLGHEHDVAPVVERRAAAASSPMRMRGPCRSPRMAIGRPISVGDVANERDRRGVLLVRAVREVDAGDVEARVR